MQLKLTWRITGQNKDMNLLVPEEQKISETLLVLAEKGMVAKEVAEGSSYVKSLRTDNRIPMEMTYKEGNIYSGDILLLE